MVSNCEAVYCLPYYGLTSSMLLLKDFTIVVVVPQRDSLMPDLVIPVPAKCTSSLACEEPCSIRQVRDPCVNLGAGPKQVQLCLLGTNRRCTLIHRSDSDELGKFKFCIGECPQIETVRPNC